MGDKSKEELLWELSEVQKGLEEKTELHGKMIKRFLTLLENDGLFSQIIDFFPYPIAIFTPQFTLAVVNKAFVVETKMEILSKEKETVRIHLYKADDTRLACAVTRVFNGETFFIEDLKNPFSIFFGTAQQDMQQSDHFNRAVIFPVPSDDAEITHGVLLLMP